MAASGQCGCERSVWLLLGIVGEDATEGPTGSSGLLHFDVQTGLAIQRQGALAKTESSPWAPTGTMSAVVTGACVCLPCTEERTTHRCPDPTVRCALARMARRQGRYINSGFGARFNNQCCWLWAHHTQPKIELKIVTKSCCT